MRFRYRKPVPLSTILFDLLKRVESTCAVADESRDRVRVLQEPPPDRQATVATQLDPGCTVPFVGMLLVAAALLAAAPGIAHGQTVLYENFDTVTAPDLPAGWSADTGWATSASSTSTGSGGNNLAHTGTGTAHATTPSIDLGGASAATISYLARRTSSYPMENLRVAASVDGGSTWPYEILGSGLAAPGGTSTWEPVEAALPAGLLGESDVRFRFEATGGTTSGANLRLDDVQVVTEGGGSPGGSSSLGFSSGSSTTPAQTGGVPVDLALILDAPDGLAALQFTVSWDDDLLSWSGITPGAAISAAGDWTVTAQSGFRSVTVLIVGPSGASLASGTFNPIASLVFDVGPLPEGIPLDVTLVLSDVIGAQATPTGDDAGISISNAVHVMTVSEQAAVFDAPPIIDLGTAAVGDTLTGILTVSNVAGTVDLTISGVSVDDDAFEIAPQAVVVPAGGTTDFTVTFTPDGSVLGERSADLIFSHDGSNGPSTLVRAIARVGAGRGDANGDAVVDLLDLLVGIDVAIGRIEPSSAVEASLDLYPFPAGDGSVDVRDLTVLIQAIILDAWPDGQPLPSGSGSAGKIGGSSRPVVATLRSVPSDDGYELRLSVTEPLRGLQLHLLLPAGTFLRPAADAEAWAPVHVGRTGNRIRLVWTRLDGDALPAGETTLAVVTGGDTGSPIVERSIAVSVSQVVGSIELADRPALPDAGGFEIEQPFPNPIRLSTGGELRIPVTGAHGPLAIRVVDLLGREVYRAESVQVPTDERIQLIWSTRNGAGRPVAPGVYLVRVEGAGRVKSRAVVVSR